LKGKPGTRIHKCLLQLLHQLQGSASVSRLGRGGRENVFAMD